MLTFCRKPHVASFYSSLTLPYTKLCHRQTDRYTYEIKYVRFRRYACISFAIFLLRKKYIVQLDNILTVLEKLIVILLIRVYNNNLKSYYSLQEFS